MGDSEDLVVTGAVDVDGFAFHFGGKLPQPLVVVKV